ncbi:hypothetical protein A7K94_0213705 [Modestobacter sp. VKM Ac-2676]|nr:hypothetical protein A7K94_0213705 [Modestobacter sp. VKM Ac-2676]
MTGGEVLGRPVPDGVLGEQRLTVAVHAPPADGVTATFRVAGDGPVTVRALDGTDGLAEVPGFAGRRTTSASPARTPRTCWWCRPRSSCEVQLRR